MGVWTDFRRNLQFFGAIGLTQVSFDGTSDHLHYRLSRGRTIYSIIVLFTIVFVLGPVSYYLIYLFRIDTRPNTIARMAGHIYYSVSNPFVGCLTIASGLANQKLTIKTINKFGYIAKSVQKLTGSSPRYQYRKYAGAIFIYLILCLISDFTETTLPNFFKEYLIEYVGIGYFLIAGSQFGIFTMAIASTFNEMKNGLKRFLKRTHCFVDDVPLAKPEYVEKGNPYLYQPERTIQRYRILYHDLYEVSLKVNKLFSTANLWLVGHCTAFTINATYNALGDLQNATSKQELAHGIYNLFVWSGLGLFIMGTVVYPCEQVKYESSDVGRIVDKFLARCENPKIIKELKQFSTLTDQKKVKFSPHGVFTLKSSIIFTIVGATISYLVILTQDTTTIINND